MDFFKKLSLISLNLVVGCASITSGENQSIQFSTRDKKGDAVEGAQCDWKNSRASGSVITPGAIQVKRDYDALHVVCKKENYSIGSATANSKAQAAMGANILAGGLIGAAVDHSTGNAYEYPSAITVRMGDTIQINTQNNTRPQRQTVHSHKDPSLIPQPSGYASISDVGAIPTKSQGCRDIYSRYLNLSVPKSIAFSATGACASRIGEDAMQEALLGCSKHGPSKCTLYAVDNEVVWIKP